MEERVMARSHRRHSMSGAVLSFTIGAIVVLCACGGPTASKSPAAPSSPTPPVPPQPAGHTLSGTVTEPGGGPIPGVAISTRPNPSGGPARTGTAITDGAGHYEMHDVAGCLWVRTDRDGYEGGEWVNCVSVTDGDAKFDTTMQRVLRIEAGGSLDERVLPNDMGWLLDLFTDDGCGPCKIVRIVAPKAGTVLARVTWTGAPDALSLWTQSGVGSLYDFAGLNEASGTTDVASGQELVTFIAWESPQNGGEQPFHLESRLLAPGEPAPATSTRAVPTRTRSSAARLRLRMIR
jgi:hypothetical protein